MSRPSQAFQYERFNVNIGRSGSHGVKESRGTVFVELVRHETLPAPCPTRSR